MMDNPAVVEQLTQFRSTLSEAEQNALYEFVLRAEGLSDHRALASLPAEALFNEEERRLIDELDAEEETEPILPPNVVLIMKATRLCNLRCTYCNAWREGADQNMTFEVLARITHGTLRDRRRRATAGNLGGVTTTAFIWHGGEPLLRDVSFYLRALWLQHHWRRDGHEVSNRIQSNGSRITAEYVDFCKRFGIGVAISLDGPPEIHDQRRLDAAGRPTSERVHAGLRMLQDAGLGKAVLMVVDEDVLERGPQRLLDYLEELGVENVGLLNLVPGNRDDGVDADGAWLHWARYLAFLRDLFALWYDGYRDQISIRELTQPLDILRGGDARYCVFQTDCFEFAFDVDPNGTITGCDKYVGDPAFRYGSILESPVRDVLTNALVQEQRERDRRDTDALRDCRWFHVCQGGCPHDRDVNAAMNLEGVDGCCGLGPLLDDIDEMDREHRLTSSSIDTTFGNPVPHIKSAVVPVRIGARSPIRTR
jgi:uncharacterized protein